MHVQVYLLECSLRAKAIDLLAGSQIWRPRERERERERERKKEGGSKRGRATGEKRAGVCVRGQVSNRGGPNQIKLV